MRPLVYVTRPVHADAITLLEQHADVALGYGPAARAFDDVADDVAGLLVRTDPLTGEEIARAPRLRVIARHGVGVDNIAVGAATSAGVAVVNTPEANVRSVAEHVFALILAVGRRVLEADEAVRGGRFGTRDSLVGTELWGKRIAIVGLGRIGGHVARIAAHGFGMHVVGFDPGLDQDEIVRRGAEPAPTLHDLLRDADVLTVHVPLTPDTAGMIGAGELALLRAGAIVIQASRGGVIDEDALARELRDRRLAGAGIDVFASEPPAGSPLLDSPSTVLTPHTAAHTNEAMARMALDAAQGIIDVLAGELPAGQVVNLEALQAAQR